MNKYVKRCRRLRAEVAELKTAITRLRFYIREIQKHEMRSDGSAIVTNICKEALKPPAEPAPRIVSNLPPDEMKRAEALLKDPTQ